MCYAECTVLFCRLVLLYPQLVSVQSLGMLLDDMCAHAEWDLCASLCSSLRRQVALPKKAGAHKQPHQQQQQQQVLEDMAAGTSSSVGGLIADMSSAADSTGGGLGAITVIEMSEDHLRQIVWHLLQLCIGTPVGLMNYCSYIYTHIYVYVP